MATSPEIVPAELIERRIFLIRSYKVILDSDLAQLYGVPTKAFNQAVKRNLNRFPPDFMIQLTDEEAAVIRSQSVTGSHRNLRHRPYAFTEQGVAMLSSLLSSERAAQVNIAIMRVFVRLREVMASHRDLAEKIEALEEKYRDHDEEIQAIFGTLRDVLEPSTPQPRRQIGFPVEFPAKLTDMRRAGREPDAARCFTSETA